MEKSKIFIASSSRTLVLAEMLQDQLQTEFCEATLWSEEGRRRPGVTIIEMLEAAADGYDFAVIILAQDDVMVKESGDTLKARDNCVFEAGLFINSLGRERCFLVNSVDNRDLPSDLSGIISVRFVEPKHGMLSNRQECAHAIRSVSATLKDSVQSAGRRTTSKQLPVLSISDVLKRERIRAEKGDLNEGSQIIVCDIAPDPELESAAIVRQNLKAGIRYHYFLQLTEDTVNKLLDGLQMLLVGTADASGKNADFPTRLETLNKEKERVLQDLDWICQSQNLLVSLMPLEPQFNFRVHNAGDPLRATVYLKFHTGGFTPWAQGTRAESISRQIPEWVSLDGEPRIFVPIKNVTLEGARKRQFENALRRGLHRYFPGIEEGVRQRCVGLGSQD